MGALAPPAGRTVRVDADQRSPKLELRLPSMVRQMQIEKTDTQRGS